MVDFHRPAINNTGPMTNQSSVVVMHLTEGDWPVVFGIPMHLPPFEGLSDAAVAWVKAQGEK